jgi:hypothetical protein
MEWYLERLSLLALPGHDLDVFRRQDNAEHCEGETV